MGQIRHRSIERHPDLVLHGIADPALALGPGGVPVHASYKQLLAAKPEVVFVCTPPNVTADVVSAALRSGCHVLCEKPPGRDLRDLERIAAVARERPELKLVFGFNHRHHLSVRDAKAIVDGGTLGRILWMRGVYGKSGGPGFERTWRNDPAVSGGGILFDQGIHMLDLFRFFCGDFNEVMAMTSTSFWDIPVEDNAFVLLRSAAGQIAQLHSSATLWKHTFRLEIGLERGYLVLGGILSRSGTYGRESLLIGRRSSVGSAEPREETVFYDADPSWDVEVGRFVEAIRLGLPITESGFADAISLMRIIERVYSEPSRSGRTRT